MTWRNGVALRLDVSDTPAKIAQEIGPALDTFEYWMLHDGVQECSVCANIGPGVHFFRQVQECNSDSRFRIQQLFIKHGEENWEKDRVSEGLSKTYRKLLHKPIMYFDDGRIYLIHTAEDERITWQRAQSYPRQLLEWTICDSDGTIFGSGGWISL